MTDITWTNSSLSLLERCGEAYRRRYLEGEVMPPSPRMLRGTVVAGVAKVSMLRKLDHAELPSVEEAQDLAATDFETNWRAGVSLNAEERAAGPQVTHDTSKDFAIGLSS